MDKPTIAGKEPVKVNLEADKNYAWCTCGLSANQPFCNGAHKGTSFSPDVFKQEKEGDAYLCNCKHTKNPPYCDGSHKSL